MTRRLRKPVAALASITMLYFLAPVALSGAAPHTTAHAPAAVAQVAR